MRLWILIGCLSIGLNVVAMEEEEPTKTWKNPIHISDNAMLGVIRREQQKLERELAELRLMLAESLRQNSAARVSMAQTCNMVKLLVDYALTTNSEFKEFVDKRANIVNTTPASIVSMDTSSCTIRPFSQQEEDLLGMSEEEQVRRAIALSKMPPEEQREKADMPALEENTEKEERKHKE